MLTSGVGALKGLEGSFSSQWIVGGRCGLKKYLKAKRGVN